MRKTSSKLYDAIRAQEEADEKQSSRLMGVVAFLDRFERARQERDAALIAGIMEVQASDLAEMREIKAECHAMLAELRGTPTTIEGETEAATVTSIESRKSKKAEG